MSLIARVGGADTRVTWPSEQNADAAEEARLQRRQAELLRELEALTRGATEQVTRDWTQRLEDIAARVAADWAPQLEAAAPIGEQMQVIAESARQVRWACWACSARAEHARMSCDEVM